MIRPPKSGSAPPVLKGPCRRLSSPVRSTANVVTLPSGSPLLKFATRSRRPSRVIRDGFGTIAGGGHWLSERLKHARRTHPERGHRSRPIAIGVECDIQSSPVRGDHDSPRAVAVGRSGRSVGRKSTACQDSEPGNIVGDRVRRPQSPAIRRHGDDERTPAGGPRSKPGQAPVRGDTHAAPAP